MSWCVANEQRLRELEAENVVLRADLDFAGEHYGQLVRSGVARIRELKGEVLAVRVEADRIDRVRVQLMEQMGRLRKVYGTASADRIVKENTTLFIVSPDDGALALSALESSPGEIVGSRGSMEKLAEITRQVVRLTEGMRDALARQDLFAGDQKGRGEVPSEGSVEECLLAHASLNGLSVEVACRVIDANPEQIHAIVQEWLEKGWFERGERVPCFFGLGGVRREDRLTVEGERALRAKTLEFEGEEMLKAFAVIEEEQARLALIRKLKFRREDLRIAEIKKGGGRWVWQNEGRGK